jgi:phospholipid/cholesterol/gamma-HCH transport system substrate-binding protein
MITGRTRMNIAAFLAASFVLIYLGFTQLVLQPGGGRTIRLDFSDASGLAPRNDVTMRGVPVGAVRTVALLPSGLARVVVQLEPGVEVASGARAEIQRRSPIGDLTVDLIPGNGAPMRNGGLIPVGHTRTPPDPEKTIEALARVLHAVPSQDLGSLVSDLAVALKGRASDLASLSETTADLPERLLQVRTQLESLITNGPKVTGVLAQNAKAFANDITQTAILADILRDRRYDLVSLMKNGARFARVANDLISGEKPNILCMVQDFGTVNTAVANRLNDLIGTLDLNHFFFDGVWQSVQTGLDGHTWFRVDLLPPQQPPAAQYVPKRGTPDVYAANGCRNMYGTGVGPGTQPGPVWLANGSHLQKGS